MTAEPLVAGETLALRARTGTGVNWVGAFLLYAKGATLQEVSDQMGIRFDKLKTRWREEDWEALVKMQRELAIKAPAPSATSAVVVKDADARIQANREQAIKISQGLRAHIQSILDQYEQAKIFLPPQDIAILAKAAKDIDTAAMTALGDDPAPKLPPPAAGSVPAAGKHDRPIQHFHINLPGLAQRPRVPRRVQQEGETISVVSRPSQRDAVTDPSPPRPRVELTSEPVASEVIEGDNGRSSVDFAQLSKVSKPEPVVKPTVNIPAFARG